MHCTKSSRIEWQLHGRTSEFIRQNLHESRSDFFKFLGEQPRIVMPRLRHSKGDIARNWVGFLNVICTKLRRNIFAAARKCIGVFASIARNQVGKLTILHKIGLHEGKSEFSRAEQPGQIGQIENIQSMKSRTALHKKYEFRHGLAQKKRISAARFDRQDKASALTRVFSL